jgi:hypothetical protein
MQIVPATVEHFLAVHPAELASLPNVVELIREGAYAAVDDDGVWCVGGIVDMCEGRAIAWTLLNRSNAAKLPFVHRVVKGVVESSHFRRIELVADIRFPRADEWALRLGFSFEGILRSYFPDGSQAHLYSRVK